MKTRSKSKILQGLSREAPSKTKRSRDNIYYLYFLISNLGAGGAIGGGTAWQQKRKGLSILAKTRGQGGDSSITCSTVRCDVKWKSYYNYSFSGCRLYEVRLAESFNWCRDGFIEVLTRDNQGAILMLWVRDHQGRFLPLLVRDYQHF